ncbi:peptidyl-tRNA hydrolase PTH2 [Pseudoloma neurophilia]|uniref:peptidyl-tRNA hydrolase n=1 Tax=Pseudoloma neurophilia TaxID=146866 RepID=A0A0R0LYI9_9MICR|nr:peptidyl-tRNA hydrolase PTH2 [Pseudoloma neurophilia]
MTHIVQYIILRSDLKNYTTGMLTAQACHACISANEKFKNNSDTVEYLKDIKNMKKVILKADNEQFEILKSKLFENHFDFIIWLEFPEKIETALALRPYEIKNETGKKLKEILKKLKLY